ncbi:hypothetical protein GJ496_011554 [Pomphorhynchus laevis]|nr:hypothetical protein GJ496_011554 [Pomphorhynchus laevis]
MKSSTNYKSRDKLEEKGRKRPHPNHSPLNCRLSIEPIQGLSYKVKNRHGQVRNALVLTKRNNSKRNGMSEYFVHFEDSDRRLDEWVNIDQILCEATIVEDRKSNDEVVTLGKACDGANDSRELTKSSPRPVRRTRQTTNIFNNSSSPEWDCQNRQMQEKLNSSESKPTTCESDEEYIKIEMEFVERTKVKYIDCIQFGNYEIQCWYFSPFPQSFCVAPKLFICEHCLSYMKREVGYCYHLYVCKQRHPPGKVIYRKDAITVYNVDSNKHKLFCQKLCLLGKLFLDHKTVYYDVEPFDFYIVTVKDDQEEEHLVGYFTKEKHSMEHYNLACILVLPPYQQHGYGKFIISLSYELSKRDGIQGTPERPLSDLGLRSYDSFWRWKILEILRSTPVGETVPINRICEQTGFTTPDVLETLHKMQFLKYFQGKHVVITDRKRLNSEIAKCKEPRFLLDPDLLIDNSVNNYTATTAKF